MDSSAEISERSSDAGWALTAGFLGWTLDAFDFFLVIIALPAIAHDLGRTKLELTFSITLTLMFRPVGALIFGLLADRYGRRGPMILDLLFYSAVEVATAFAHSFGTFLVLRALFGIGTGGEWGVGASLVMEKVPPRLRGVLSGLLQEGYAVGYLLAAVAAHFTLDRYGWRPMFLLGGLPALLTLLIRFGVRESAVWEQHRSGSWRELGRGIAANWKLWLYLTVLMAMMNFSSHGTQDNYPTFLKSDRGVSTAAYTDVVALSMIGAITGGIAFGMASDRIGRRTAMSIALLGALAVLPLWTGARSLAWVAAGAMAMQFMIQGAWGVVPAHINELSPDAVRGFLPGFAYQCGNLIAASIATIQAALAVHGGYGRAMTISCGIIFVIAIGIVLAGPEKRGVRFGS